MTPFGHCDPFRASEPVGEVNLFTASTGDLAEVMDVYVVDLACAGDRPGPMAEDLRVIGSPKLSGLKVDMLLGRPCRSRSRQPRGRALPPAAPGLILQDSR